MEAGRLAQRLWVRTRDSLFLLPLFILSYWIAFLLRFEFSLPLSAQNCFLHTVGWFVLVKLVIFAAIGGFPGWARFVTFYDLLSLIRATTLAVLAAVLFERLVIFQNLVARSIFVLDWGITIALIGGTLAACRLWREGTWFAVFSSNRQPVLIVGANDAGETLLRSINRNKELNYHVVGFIDSDAQRIGTRIAGVPVIGTIEETCRIAEKKGIDQVLVVSGSISGKKLRELIREAKTRSIKVQVLPSIDQLIRGTVAARPRNVSIDDLLRREPVTLDLEAIRQWIDNRSLLVTGSAGSIGSEICRQLLRFAPRKLVALDRAETGQFFLEKELAQCARQTELVVTIADVLDQQRMSQLLRQHKPDVIFHAAAYKHVPLMELHPGEAVKNIVIATRRLADLAASSGVRVFVMVSTDKAVNPTSVMGACKRVAEMYVQSLADVCDCRFVTVRFGNVLDSAGSVVQVFRQQIAAGGPVTVTDPRMVRYFMTIPEAAQLVIQAGGIGRSGEILLLDMGEPVRILDLAEDMIRLSGLRPGEDIEIEFTGCRPGEKLFEELHSADEKYLSTQHPKIMIADRRRHDLAKLTDAINRLEQIIYGPDELIVAELQKIVPEYTPNRVLRPERKAA